MNNRHRWIFIGAALVLAAVVGVVAYNAGMATADVAANGAARWQGHGWGFPFFFVPFFVLAFWLVAMRAMFGRRRCCCHHGHHHHHDEPLERTA